MISPTGYIAKKELEKVPFLSWIMRFVNCIFLDRKDPRNGLKAVLSAADMIKSGISVFLFLRVHVQKQRKWVNLRMAVSK